MDEGPPREETRLDEVPSEVPPTGVMPWFRAVAVTATIVPRRRLYLEVALPAGLLSVAGQELLFPENPGWSVIMLLVGTTICMIVMHIRTTR